VKIAQPFAEKVIKQEKTMKNEVNILLTEEGIISLIYTIRGLRVMIDRDLAILYQVETKVLNQAVRRNLQRFPSDFMFQLNQPEFENWKSQIVTSKSVAMGLRKKPLAFTEQGIAMLSSVLNSDLAIQMNIRIIRVFTKMRKLLETHQEIFQRLMVLEKNDEDQEQKIMLILDYLKSIELKEQEDLSLKNRNRIGFKIGENSE
jgi:hypothetical protein